jgi:hypothetical protein
MNKLHLVLGHSARITANCNSSSSLHTALLLVGRTRHLHCSRFPVKSTPGNAWTWLSVHLLDAHNRLPYNSVRQGVPSEHRAWQGKPYANAGADLLWRTCISVMTALSPTQPRSFMSSKSATLTQHASCCCSRASGASSAHLAAPCTRTQGT